MWKRYLFTNVIFIYLFIKEFISVKLKRNLGYKKN